MSEFQESDSGWTLINILYIEVNLNKYSPMRGSSYVEVPEPIKKKRAIKNVQNVDSACLAWAITSALRIPKGLPQRVTSYPHYDTVADFSELKFPLNLKDISIFEAKNQISINVYGLVDRFDGQVTLHEIVGPLYFTKKRKMIHINLLLLTTDEGNAHYCWIRNLSRLISSQGRSGYLSRRYICEGCLVFFSSDDKLQRLMGEDCKQVKAILPTTDPKISKYGEQLPGNILKFDKFEKQLRAPFVIYADFEAVLKPIHYTEPNPSNGYTVKCFEHIPHSYAYYIKCSYDDNLSKLVLYRGEENYLSTPVEMKNLTQEEHRNFNDARICHICEKEIQKGYVKVRDHDHMTGAYRGAAHMICNVNYKEPRFIPIIFHNLSNYDAHLFVKSLSLEKEERKYMLVTQSILTDRMSNHASTGNVATEGQLKFGWIQGVLVRCLLNIWGVMLFLRLSWVVAQAGVGQAMILILTTTAVTSITALSMSAISTNGVIKGGGTYYMISRSLGPEFGGSIGLIFALANAIACAMYIVGFCESMNDLLKEYGLYIIDNDVQDVRIIGSITIVILTLIVVFGMEWEAKAQNGLLVILLVAIADFLIGSFIGPKSEVEKAQGFVGYNVTLLKENMLPDYRYAEGVPHNFFSVFSIFFPAATGILAGANISGDLKDPQKAIPKGTLLSIAITSFSYLLMAFVVGFTVMRDATGIISNDTSLTISLVNETVFNVTEITNSSLVNVSETVAETGLSNITKYPFGSHNNFQVISLVSWIGPIIYAGCFAATLSSALASLVSAPKVFQALCQDKLYPHIYWFAKGYGQNNEPIRGYILTFVISIAFILIGELNLIAPLISNFFLAAYTLINFSTFHASLAKPVGWRPTFKYYNMWLSLAGAILCVMVMFLISWWTALVTFAAVLALYLIVSKRKPDVNWGSTTQAQIYKNALQAVHQLNSVEDHVKNYRPQILILSGMPSARPSLMEIGYLLTKNISMLVCGHVNTNLLPQRVRHVLQYKANSWLRAHKIKAFYIQVDGMSFDEGARAILTASGIGKLRPNILLMGHKSDWQKCCMEDLNMYFEVLHNALDLHVSVGILRLQTGLDFSQKVEEEQQNTFIPRNTSYSQMSQASSVSDIYVPQTPRSRTKETSVNTRPNPEEEDLNKRKGYSIPDEYVDAVEDNISKELHDHMFPFQKKQKKNGTIDVWWLYDDGGLTLLLPYILSTRKNWNKCKLRVFTLANKRNELEFEHRNMASLLAKFRIDYSDLNVVPDITSKPSDATQQFFDALIADFRKPDNEIISESELLAVKDKTNRHLRLRELLLQYSHNTNLVVMSLPMPRKNIVSAPLYLAWLELLTKDMPPILLVRGNQSSVLTFYS